MSDDVEPQDLMDEIKRRAYEAPLDGQRRAKSRRGQVTAAAREVRIARRRARHAIRKATRRAQRRR